MALTTAASLLRLARRVDGAAVVGRSLRSSAKACAPLPVATTMCTSAVKPWLIWPSGPAGMPILTLTPELMSGRGMADVPCVRSVADAPS